MEIDREREEKLKITEQYLDSLKFMLEKLKKMAKDANV